MPVTYAEQHESAKDAVAALIHDYYHNLYLEDTAEMRRVAKQLNKLANQIDRVRPKREAEDRERERLAQVRSRLAY